MQQSISIVVHVRAIAFLLAFAGMGIVSSGCEGTSDVETPDETLECPESQCTLGATRCAGDGLEACVLGADTCLSFVLQEDCSASDRQCESSDSNTAACLSDSCFNEQLDSGETDVDCGGDCAPCANGAACADASDCQSGECDETSVCVDECQTDEYGIDCTPCATHEGEVCGAGACNDGLLGDGSCECPANYAGPTCDSCDAGYAGTECVQCSNGTFCPGSQDEGTACATGTWDDDADPATACVAHRECVDGVLVQLEGTATSDVVCGACAEGTWNHDDDVETACVAYTECTVGQQVVSNPTEISDRVCEDCPANTFDHDTDPATDCIEHTTCAVGTTETEPPSATSDRVCTPCASGHFDHDADPMTACFAHSECAVGSAVSVPGTASTDVACEVLEYVAVSAGRVTTCGLDNLGGVTCWGVRDNVPADLVATQISVGGMGAAAVNEDDRVVVWGYGSQPYNQDVASVRFGEDQVCAITPDSDVKCWGNESRWHFDATLKAKSVFTGDYYTCLVLEQGLNTVEGEVRCGNEANQAGQLDPTTDNEGFLGVTGGFSFTCGWKAPVPGGATNVTCWRGDTSHFGNLETLTVRGVSSSNKHWCARDMSDNVICGGDNDDGQGDVPAGYTAVQISVGGKHSCGLNTLGEITCWGDNGFGQTDVRLPRQ